jgi:hypothetical protein
MIVVLTGFSPVCQPGAPLDTHFTVPYSLHFAYPSENAPVAQLDRASDYESEGRMFESCRVH